MHNLNFNKMHGEKLNRNYARMLHAILNKSLKQHPTKQLLSVHFPSKDEQDILDPAEEN